MKGLKIEWGYGLYDSKAVITTENSILKFLYSIYLEMLGFRETHPKP